MRAHGEGSCRRLARQALLVVLGTAAGGSDAGAELGSFDRRGDGEKKQWRAEGEIPIRNARTG